MKTFEYKIFTFKGFEERKGQTFVQFECEGKKYEQETFLLAGIDKMKKYEAEGKGFLNVIKHLVYTGEIDTLKSNLVGKRIWLLSAMWLRDTEEGYGAYQKDGFKYYPAVVSQIGLGSADAPIRVVFKPDNQNEAYIDIYLSGINQRNQLYGLHFDKVFSFKDPKTKYPKISNENWSLIQSGKVKIGMNEEECKLSWGKPDTINSTTLEGLVSEQWVYGSSFLYLTNGLLTSIQN